MNIKKVIVIGPQRVGTNFITSLIEENNTQELEVIPSGNREYFWKHSLPDETGQNYSKNYLTPEEAIILNKDLFVIIVSKHPFDWLESIKRNSADLFYKRKNIYEKDDISIEKAIKFYANYYQKWLNVLPQNQHIHVKYTDILEKPKIIIKEIFGLAAPEDIKIPNKVPFSTGNYSLMVERYSKSEKNHIKYKKINNMIGDKEKEIFLRLGYFFVNQQLNYFTVCIFFLCMRLFHLLLIHNLFLVT